MSASRSTTLTLAFSSDVVRTAPTGQLHLVTAGGAPAVSIAGGPGVPSVFAPTASRGTMLSTGERVNADFWDQRHMS